MSWPIWSDYSDTVQNPHFCFTDPELKASEVTKNSLGLPKPITGAFASVYQLKSPSGRTWAVRCFLREIPDQQNRYAAISAHLRSASLAYTVGFQYLDDGIRVNNRSHPILKMEWLDGVPLNDYIEQHLARPQDLKALAKQWIDMMAALKRFEIAHGDLQHGNILVSNGNLKLIDYDGMYVPALKGMHSHEVGQPNYQHPKRTASDFNPQLDNFSAWVIYISLLAFAIEPRLWSALNCGDENLLFRRSDYEHPVNSKVFRALDASGKPQLKSLADQLRSLLYLPLSSIPFLDGLAVQPVPAKSVIGVPEWLSDHLPEQKLESLQKAEAPTPVVAGADWIFDQLIDQKPLAPAIYSVPLVLERIVLFGFALLTVASIILTSRLGRSPWSPAAATGINVGVIAGFLVFRYRSLGIVGEKSKVFAKISAGHQVLAQIEISIHTIEAERARSMEPLIALDQKYRTVPQRLQQGLRDLQRHFDETLKGIADRRAGLDLKEEAELQQVDSSAQRQRSELARRRTDSEGAEQHERDVILGRIRQEFMSSFLRSQFIRDAALHGIGPKLKTSLASHNVVCAADIDSRIYSVPGIGDAKAKQLAAWRAQVEWYANQHAPTAIPALEDQRIRATYMAQRQLLDQGTAASTDQQMQQRETITSNFARYRHQLFLEEEAAKRNVEKRAELARTESQVEKEQLAKSFQNLKLKTDAIRKDLDARSLALSQSKFKQRTGLHQLERELGRYRGISFIRYLGVVFGFRRKIAA